MSDTKDVRELVDPEGWTEPEVMYGPEVPLAVRLEHIHELTASS